MPILGDVLGGIPGLAGYQAQRQINEAQPLQQMQQVGALQTILAQAAQQRQMQQNLADEQMLRPILQQTGGDPTKAIQALLQAGTPASLNLAAKIHALAPPPKQAVVVSPGASVLGPDNKPVFTAPPLPLKSDQPGTTRQIQRGENVVTEELQADGSWKEIGSGPKFSKSVAPTIINSPAPTMSEIIDPTNPSQMIRVDARTYKGGGLGSPGVLGVSGKEPTAAKREETGATGREQVGNLVMQLRDAYQQLDKSGGIANPEKSVISNLSAGLSTSGVGQFTGRMLGTQNQSLRNSIAQTRPLLLNAIKQATGMSARQMDSNAELKMYLAAATDPTLDIKANLAALDMLDKLYGTSAAPKANIRSVENSTQSSGWSIRPIQ